MPENVLPFNAREQSSVVPVGRITKLDPKLDWDPVPLFLIVLLRQKMLLLLTLSRLTRMLPVMLPLKTLFSMWVVKVLPAADISNGTLETEVCPSKVFSEQTTEEVPFSVRKIPLELFRN